MHKQSDDLIDRWRLTSDLFGRVFCDDVGIEPESIVRKLVGFQLKEIRFRRDMERLRNIATRELPIEVERNRHQLLISTFKALNNMYSLQCSRRVATTTYPPPLCLSRIKVTFKDEQGEGSGVARSFYTAFAEAVLADAPFPAININESSSTQLLTPTTCTPPPPQYVPFSMHRYRNSSRSSVYSNDRRLNNTLIIRSSLRPRDLSVLASTSSISTTSATTSNKYCSRNFFIKLYFSE